MYELHHFVLTFYAGIIDSNGQVDLSPTTATVCSPSGSFGSPDKESRVVRSESSTTPVSTSQFLTFLLLKDYTLMNSY